MIQKIRQFYDLILCENLAQKTFIFSRKPYSLSVISVRRLQLNRVVFVLLESYICFREL